MPNIQQIKVDDYEARNKTKPKEIVSQLFFFLAFEENGEKVPFKLSLYHNLIVKDISPHFKFNVKKADDPRFTFVYKF